MAFSTVIEIYSQRNESTSSVYFAALSCKSLILLTMGEYKQCIEMCSTTIETLHSASNYDDDDLPKTKEEIEFALVLYMGLGDATASRQTYNKLRGSCFSAVITTIC